MFESEFRDEIFNAIKYVFWKTNQQNMPVFGVHDKLKDYATSKKDISNGVEVHPKEEYRLKDEDIFETVGGSDATGLSNGNSF